MSTYLYRLSICFVIIHLLQCAYRINAILTNLVLFSVFHLLTLEMDFSYEKLEGTECIKAFFESNSHEKSQTFLGFLEEDYYKDVEMAFIATLNDEPIGWIAGQHGMSKKDLVLNHLFVFPSYRKKGIGSVLVSKFEENARDKKCNKITLLSKADVIDFWERHGFEAKREGDRHMTKRIK